MGLELAKAFISVRGDSSRLTGDFNRMKGKVSSAMHGLATVATGILAGVGVAAGVGGFIALVKSGETFNQKMRQSLAIMGDVSDMLKTDMRQAAFDAARVTKFSAAQAAEAYYFLASAGLSAQQSIGAMPAVSQFAAAGNFDLARATDILTDAQSALGLSSKDTAIHMANMNRVADATVAAAAGANATVSQFGEALMNKGALGAKLVGMELEEALAIMMVLADKGFAKGTDAGQALWMALRDLKTQAVINASAFKSMGINVDAGGGKFANMADIIEDLDKAFAGLAPLEVQKKLSKLGLPGKSLAPILTLLGTSKQLRNFQKDLESAGGSAKKVAEKQLTPLQEATARLGAAWTEMSSDMMKWAGPILGKAISRFAGWFKSIRAGFSLLNDLFKSTADFFSAVWEISIRFVSNQFGSFGNMIKEVFKGIIGDLDVMLGSWEGFREGLVMGANQAVVGVQTAWEGISNSFKIQMEKMKGLSKGFFQKFQNLAAKAAIVVTQSHPGGLTAELQDRLFGLMDIGMNQRRKDIENKTNTEVERLRKQHEGVLASLGQKSLDLTEEWKKKMAELPKLSENFRDKLKKINEELEKSILPELVAPKLPEAAGTGSDGKGQVRFGFAEFGRHIQDAILQKQDPVEKAVKEAQKTNDAALGKIDANLTRINSLGLA